MSFGSLSGAAIEALNRGAAMAGCLHNTGEGGLTEHHRHGGELTFQIGTGYFGCRDEQGRFSLERLLATIEGAPVRSIEIKLSQGAKPGLGGLLPAAKVTPQIAALRGIPVGVDCKSPNRHSAFGDVDTMIEFIESLAEATGLPVGIKSAVGEQAFWVDLAARMADHRRRPRLRHRRRRRGRHRRCAAGVRRPRLAAVPAGLPAGVPGVRRGRDCTTTSCSSARAAWGWPNRGLTAMALGCDMVNVAREAMLAIGCIQSQRCHTGRCPTGVATQSPRLERGLDPADKSVRCALLPGGAAPGAAATRPGLWAPPPVARRSRPDRVPVRRPPFPGPGRAVGLPSPTGTARLPPSSRSLDACWPVGAPG